MTSQPPAVLNAVLISTYDMGRQPFGIASAAAWLKQAGAQVTCLDLAIQSLPRAPIADAALIAFYLPMHTATRIAVTVLQRVRKINPKSHLCCFGLYAPVNADYLRSLGADTVLGAEFESDLVALLRRLAAGTTVQPTIDPFALVRQTFIVPERGGLPPPSMYAQLEWGDKHSSLTGYTEASRGCKHQCRHCPIVPVYGGRFFAVPREVVLADIANQVAAGAQHITFGDPDFFNGPSHAIQLVRTLHEQFPHLTYDVTIKVEHLLKHATLLPVLRETGCALLTSAIEAVDDHTLALFDKQHTRADFLRAVELCRAQDLTLNPTFVAFHPWLTLDGYIDLLTLLDEWNLVDQVAPIQLAIRLLIPAGSRLLELAEVRQLVLPFDQAALAYPWAHPDPRVDVLQQTVLRLVTEGDTRGETRRAIFERVREAAYAATGVSIRQAHATAFNLAAKPIPRLSEPWYC